jgi:hypothetical protein
MKTYTYSEARQRFASLLDEAGRAGRVQIRRRDGQLFVVQPARQERSPLDVPGVEAGVAAGESMLWLESEREASTARLLERASSRRPSTSPPRGARGGRGTGPGSRRKH